MRKRLLCLVLACCMVVTLLLPVSVQAISADEITDEQLFLMYPQYLYCPPIDSINTQNVALCIDIIAEQSGKSFLGKGIASELENFFGLGLIIQDIFASVGWGSSYAQEAMDNAVESFLDVLAQNSDKDFMAETNGALQSEVIKRLQEIFSVYSEGWENYSESKFISKIGEILEKLNIDSSNAKEIVNKIFKSAKKVDAIYNVSICALALFSYQHETVRLLIKQLKQQNPDSDLCKELEKSYTDMHTCPARYLVNHYLRDKFAVSCKSLFKRQVY